MKMEPESKGYAKVAHPSLDSKLAQLDNGAALCAHRERREEVYNDSDNHRNLLVLNPENCCYVGSKKTVLLTEGQH